jgi:DNA-binding NtrC family response regulator
LLSLQGAERSFLSKTIQKSRTQAPGLLEQLGYTVRWAPDASSALMELEKDDIDIVCSDIVMPGKMDGVGLAKTIRARNPKLPILLMTGFSDCERNRIAVSDPAQALSAARIEPRVAGVTL